MGEIRSKIHEYGKPNESEWPPRFGKRGSGRSYWDAEKKCMVEGNPPPKYEKHGQAPLAITPSMPAQYHEGVGRVIDDRNEWRMADEQSGCITFGSREEVSRTTQKGVSSEQKALKQDRRKASLEATRAYRENPKAVKDKLRHEGEKQAQIAKKAGLNKLIKESV
jgi:hypothetical protein